MFCSFIFKCYLLRFKKDRKRTSNWNKSWVIKYGLNFFPWRSYVDIYLHISALWFRYFLFVITNYNCYRCGIFPFLSLCCVSVGLRFICLFPKKFLAWWCHPFKKMNLSKQPACCNKNKTEDLNRRRPTIF